MNASATLSPSPVPTPAAAELRTTRLLSPRGHWHAAHLVFRGRTLVQAFDGRHLRQARALVAQLNGEVLR